MKKILFFIGIIFLGAFHSCDFFSIEEDIKNLSDTLTLLNFKIKDYNDSIESYNYYKNHYSELSLRTDSIKRIVNNYQRKVNNGAKLFPIYDCYIIDKQTGVIYEDYEFIDDYIEDWTFFCRDYCSD